MSTGAVKMDLSDPQKRRLVYNMYRGILGQYNDKANSMVNSLPKSMVREDQGITRQIESMIKQSSQISGGGSPVPISPQGDVPAAPPPPPPPSFPPAPPPPPPPGLSGNIPAVRLSTQIPDKRQSGYEPPAAIQNAMMTKDKKPFTYTPGGLDLSEIRSPRMARRISRNANAPDSASVQTRPAPPPSNQPLPPSAVAAMQPQIAVAVLPPGGGMPHLQHVTPGGHSAHSAPAPPPPPPQLKSHPISPLAQNMPSPPPQPSSPQRVINRQPSPPLVTAEKLQPQHRHTKSEPQSTPGSIYVPPIETQQPRSQLGSLYIPPLAAQEPSRATPPVSQLNKAPTPWMTRQSQQEVPSWVHKENVQSPPPQYSQSNQGNQSNQGYQGNQSNQGYQGNQSNQGYQQPQTRVIPIQIEGKEPSQPNTRIIPIQLEGTPSPQKTPQQPNFNQQQSYQQQQPQYQQQQYQQQHSYEQQQQNQGRQTPRWMNQQPVYVHNKFNTGSQSPVPAEQNHGDNQPSWRHSQTNGTMQSPGPVQSQSFKVLQKITGTDKDGVDQNDAPYNSQGVPLSQLRKLQLSDDDRALMNKVKSQVSDTIVQDDEENPRYRGGYIPSKVFKMLDDSVPRGYSPAQAGQNRLGSNRTPQPDMPQQYVPPSEQQVQEPRKYTGGAIPSRSFRMLQAMTAGPDSAAVMSDGRQTPQFYNGREAMWHPNGYPYPPPPPDPNLYYSPPPYPPTPEQQQQFWDHYNAMCSYMAEMNHSYGYPPYGYPPHLQTPPLPQMQYGSDSDECGYSSTEEMNYYAAYFKKYPPPIQPYRGYYPDNRAQTPQIIITPSMTNGNTSYSNGSVSDSDKEGCSLQTSINGSSSVSGDSVGTTDDGSDTEVEDEEQNKHHGLQTIKSVPDIRVYKDNSNSDIQSQSSETEEPDEEETNEEVDEEDYEDDESLPHQLSVIYEESEHSESESIRKVRLKEMEDMETMSEGESSTATLDRGNETDEDAIDNTESSTVHVRLPLKFKFSKTENNEEVTTVIVGDSEIQQSSDLDLKENELIIQEIKKVEDPDVSVTFTIPKKREKPPSNTDDRKSEIFSYDQKNLKSKASDNVNERTVIDECIIPKYSSEGICDKEVSVVVNCSDKDDHLIERCVSESPIDFWKELSSDDIPSKAQAQTADISVSITLPTKSLSKSGSRSPYDNLTSESDESKPEESDCHWEDDSSSTSVQTVRIGKYSGTGSDNFSGSELETAGTVDEVEDTQKVPFNLVHTHERDESENVISITEKQSKEEEQIPIEDLLYDDSSSSDDDDESSSSSSSDSSEESYKETKEMEVTSSTVNSTCKSEQKIDDDVFLTEGSKNETSNHLTVKKKQKKTNSKSQDDSEEDDSGVTSDMSRHISETDTDPECGSELKKLSPYQRAATHSRLFKLLQDECNLEDEQSALENTSTADSESISFRKERLSLPLQTSNLSDPDSLSSSSGINSPASPTVSDKLVKELVQSLLNKKKSKHFRKLPMEKLYAAALRILQEDMDPYDTLSSDESFRHSPIGETTTSQTNNNTATNPLSQSQDLYGGNYYDYCDYYNTWGNPYYYSGVEDSLGYDILPSRAFKLLQERAQTPHGFNSGVIEGLMARCPRVLSSKDVPKDFGEVPTSDSCPQASSSLET